MKKFIAAAAAAPLSLLAVSALAGPTSSEQLDITASVAPECSLADLTNVDFGSIAIDTASGPDALLPTQSRIDSGQTVWTSCNYAATIRIEGEPMQNLDQENDGPDAGDFTDELHYRMTWRSDNGSDFLQANLRTVNGTSVDRAQNGAFHNNAILNTAFAPEDNTLRPLSGTYAATATLTLGAI